MKIALSEIFYSFQGESSFVGRTTIFIRFSGCNLRCKICDTQYSFKKNYELSVKDILKQISKINCKYVCITGGEPLAQREGLLQLVKELKKTGKIISIETNGSYILKGIPKYVKRVIDVKTPSTGCASSFDKSILKELDRNDELKFVISDKKDYQFSKDFILKNKVDKTGCLIIFSPNLKVKQFANSLVDWILKDELNVMFGPQLHKLIIEKPVKLQAR